MNIPSYEWIYSQQPVHSRDAQSYYLGGFSEKKTVDIFGWYYCHNIESHLFEMSEVLIDS